MLAGWLKQDQELAEQWMIAFFGLGLPLGGALVVLGLAKSASARLSFPTFAPRIRVARPSPEQWKLWLLASMALFVLALPLPFTSDSKGPNPTWLAIMVGWLVSHVWFSLPLLIAAWILLGAKKPGASVALCVLALLNALPIALGTSVTYGWGDYIRQYEQAPDTGYALAVAAIFAALGSGVQMKRASLAATAPPGGSA
jgi:hypothetical protein